MAELTATVDTYLAAWNEADPARRAPLIEQVWAPDGTLVDPPLDGTGHDGISAVADALHAHYPDHRFRRTGAVDAHHDRFRFTWELVRPTAPSPSPASTSARSPPTAGWPGSPASSTSRDAGRPGRRRRGRGRAAVVVVASAPCTAPAWVPSWRTGGRGGAAASSTWPTRSGSHPAT
jgi:hypothetical protein